MAKELNKDKIIKMQVGIIQELEKDIRELENENEKLKMKLKNK